MSVKNHYFFLFMLQTVLVAMLSSPRPCLSDSFFPIGMFSVGIDGLRTVKEAGFNTAHTYYSDPVQLQEFLKEAERLGLKTLVYPGDRGENGVVDYDKIGAFIRRNKGHKNILAWFIADEPELNGGSPAQMRALHSFVRKIDPGRPTAIVIHRSDRYGEYRDASNILMIDRYPVPKTPLNHVAEAARWAVTQKDRTGPVWAVIQAFGHQSPQMKGWGLREPTYEEMHAMTFLSIIYGARGIFYFTFTGSQYRIMQSPGHWNDLKKIVRELNFIYPLLLTPCAYDKVNVEIIEGSPRDERGLLPVHISEKQLVKNTAKFKAGEYFIAANASGDQVKARFAVKGLSTGRPPVMQVLEEERSLKLEKGSFVDTFKPYAVHIYEMVAQPTSQ